MKVTGRSDSELSFRGIIHIVARQTDEAENSPERGTLRFRVRRPKKRRPQCICCHSLRHPRSYSIRDDSYGARHSGLVGSLDFCLLRFCPTRFSI